MTVEVFTDAVEINGSQDITQLKVKGDDTQTEPLQSWQDSTGDELARITDDGRLQIGSFTGGSMATDESLIEGYRDEADSSKPKRGLHLKGGITGTLSSIVTWVMQELVLKGTGGISQVHTALRVLLRNENTAASGTMTGAELVAADVEVNNDGGSSGTDQSVPEMTALRVGVVNTADGYAETAYGVKVEVSNAGTLGKAYAIHTEDGIVHLGDVVELPVLDATPSDDPDADFVKVYVKLDGSDPQLYSKDSSGMERVLGGGGGSAVVSLVAPTFRLSGTTTNNALEDQSGAASINLVNWFGNHIPLYDGAAWGVLTPSNAGSIAFSVSQSISSTTTNGSPNVTVADTKLLSPGMAVSGTGIPGGATISSITNDTTYVLSANATASGTNSLTYAIPASKNFDVFGYQSTTSLLLGVRIWTNNTTRAAALTTQDGVPVLSGDTTWRYLGTARTNGSSQIEDSATKRLIWNLYHQRPRYLRVIDSTNVWSYNSTTIRQANNSSANQVEVVVGLADFSLLEVMLTAYTATGGSIGYSGIGEDTTTAFSSGQTGMAGTNAIGINPEISRLIKLVPIGHHYYAWNERGAASCVFYGDNNVAYTQSGMTGWMMA